MVVGLFIVAWLLRRRASGPEYRPDGLPFILEVVAVLLALVTGWLGGEGWFIRTACGPESASRWCHSDWHQSQ